MAAQYKSARQTIEMKEPALQVNTVIENTLDDYVSTVWTIQSLSEISVKDFAKEPKIKDQLRKVRAGIVKGLAFYKKNIAIVGRVMVADLTGNHEADIAHFDPYYLFPKMLYVVRFHPFPGKPTLFHINVAASPWKIKENKKHIGELLKKYGGGGHKGVGGVEIQGKKKMLQVVTEIIAFLNS